ATVQADPGCADALIVVSAGGSTDATVSIVERIGAADPRVRVLTTAARLGTSASVNRAVERFGDGRRWLVRLDAHAGYPRNYASRLVAKAIETGADSVVTAMFTRGESCFERAAAAAQNSFLGTGGSPRRLGRARPSRAVRSGAVPRPRRLRRGARLQRGRRVRPPAGQERRPHLAGRRSRHHLFPAQEHRLAVSPVPHPWARPGSHLRPPRRPQPYPPLHPAGDPAARAAGAVVAAVVAAGPAGAGLARRLPRLRADARHPRARSVRRRRRLLRDRHAVRLVARPLARAPGHRRRPRPRLKGMPMRRFLAACLTLAPLAVASAAAAAQSSVPSGYVEVFGDEFDEKQLDTSKWWTRYIHNGGMLDFLNDEQQRYRESGNHVMTGHSLILMAKRTGPGRYESGMIRSKRTFKYGYFEARAKVPRGRGVWPAFWLASGRRAGDGKIGWPPEIDIAELVNNGAEDTTAMLHVSAKSNGAQGLQVLYTDPAFDGRW